MGNSENFSVSSGEYHLGSQQATHQNGGHKQEKIGFNHQTWWYSGMYIRGVYIIYYITYI